MFLIFDIEGIPDYERMRATDKPALTSETNEAYLKRVTEEFCAESPEGGCFLPVRYHAPVAICALLVDDQMRYQMHASFAFTDKSLTRRGLPDFRQNTAMFWQAYRDLLARGPFTMVTFGGAGYDIPVLEASALRYGISMKDWFCFGLPNYNDPRNAWNQKSHFDLNKYLGGKGGGLHFYSRLIGFPGKPGVDGGDVEATLKKLGGLEEVTAYCWSDVLNTYALLWQVLHAGGLVADAPQANPAFVMAMDQVLKDQGKIGKDFRAQFTDNGEYVPF